MILHATYDNGTITIHEKDLPKVKADVEIVFKKKNWLKTVKRIKVDGEPVSETIIKLRDEEKW